MKSVIVDTGIWYALFDPRDANERIAARTANMIDKWKVIVPWPTMYETLRTKFVRNPLQVKQFERFLKSRNIVFLDAMQYTDEAFELNCDYSTTEKRPMSMIDCLIRLIIEDKRSKISYPATLNIKDFHDVCKRRGVLII